jgi:hypothetical protein
VAQPFRTAQADKTATPGLSGQTAKPLPYGWMEALPSIFVIAANNAKGTYPSDGVETETLTLKWFDCAQAAAAAGFAGQPTLCKDHYAVHLIYQWTPNACQGVAGADADCAKARVTKDVSFPLLRADMAAGVVRLPTWPDTPASITDTVIARIEDASSANPRVVLLDGYTLKREKTLDQGDEAYRHCRYDDDGAGWTDCDNKPGVATVVNKVRLEGPGLDPACDTQQEIAHPDVYCSKPK